MKKRNLVSVIADSINYILLSASGLIAILPFIYILCLSFATEAEIAARGTFLFPKTISFDAYKYVFSNDTILRGMMSSVLVTVMGTIVSLISTAALAYGLSKKHLRLRKLFLSMIIFTMYFGGGMIPTYIVVQASGLIDSYWSLILPGMVSTFNFIVVKNFFEQLPAELEESAKIDGYNDIQIFVKIVLPLSTAVLATFGLYYAVSYWNAFFNALLYINDSTKWPLQVILRQLVLMSQGALGDANAMGADFIEPPEQALKMAVIVIATIPILLIYPFLQKHFAKGVMIGAIKG